MSTYSVAYGEGFVYIYTPPCKIHTVLVYDGMAWLTGRAAGGWHQARVSAAVFVPEHLTGDKH